MSTSAEPCGCDARAEHVCERHRVFVGSVAIGGREGTFLAVRGPDADGMFSVCDNDGVIGTIARFELRDFLRGLDALLRG